MTKNNTNEENSIHVSVNTNNTCAIGSEKVGLMHSLGGESAGGY